MEDKKRFFGKNLQAFLDEYNMSRIDLARRLDVTPTAIWGWVNDERLPRIQYINKMCEIFHCTPGDLMNEPKPVEEVQADVLLQRIAEMAARLNNDGKEKVLTYMQDLSGRFLK